MKKMVPPPKKGMGAKKGMSGKMPAAKAQMPEMPAFKKGGKIRKGC